MSGGTATLDQNGVPSGKRKLWELLGLRHTGERAGIIGGVENGLGHYEAHSYLRLPTRRHEIFSGFEDTGILPFGGGFDIVESKGGLTPIASYIPPFPIFPPEFSWIREESPEVSTVFAGKLDSGAKVVYFAADIDRCYGRSELPDHGTLLANAVNWTLNGTAPIKVTGPGYINCKLYRKENRIIVHLINLSGCNITGYCEEYLPVGPFSVQVKDQGIRISKATLAVSERNIPLSTRDHSIILEIEKIIDHEMIILE